MRVYTGGGDTICQGSGEDARIVLASEDGMTTDCEYCEAEGLAVTEEIQVPEHEEVRRCN